MKKFIMMVTVVIMMVLVGCSSAPVIDTSNLPTEDILEIKDSNLEAVIRKALKKKEGDIYKQEVEALDGLKASKKGIKTLEGLERISKLTGEWDLSKNELINLKGFDGLSQINASLDLSSNKLTSLEGFENLKVIMMLDLSFNELIDLDEFESLHSAILLALGGNDIQDLRGLESLKVAGQIALFGNDNLFPEDNEEVKNKNMEVIKNLPTKNIFY